MAITASPVLIGVDWGTSSLRAYLIDRQGGIVDTIDASEGILSVRDGDFEAVFERLLANWLRDYPALPILLSGMISSRNGWFEVDYVHAPTEISSIASAVAKFETSAGRKLHFVTGLAVDGAETAPDVMRGEETELIGQMCHHDSDGLFLLPGTHSKWVWVEDRRILDFQTFMTGEIFAVLKQHSILGRLMASTAGSEEAFDRGVGWRTSHDNSILHILFSARTFPLFGQMAAEDVPDYLSGLLIAEEISSVLGSRNQLPRVTVIGRGDLARRYCRALELMGIMAAAVPQGRVARGHLEIARQRGLIE